LRSPSSDAADPAPSGFGAVVFDGRRCEYRGCRRCEELRRSAVVPVDVIHPGDVVEHLTAPLDVLRVLVGLLRPTGWLLEVTAPVDWRRGASAIPDRDCTTEPTSVLEVRAETVL